MQIAIKMLPAQVYMTSLVGILGKREFPLSFGNYCSLPGGERCVNMWAENLTEAAKRFLPDGQMKCLVVDEWAAFVIDERIPPEWRAPDHWCFTGSKPLSADKIERVCELLHVDKNGQAKQWIKPEEYWAERGGRYSNGVICFNLPKPTKEVDISNIKLKIYDGEPK